MNIRSLNSDDFDVLNPILDDWWGGRPVRGLLPRLFFEHFTNTSFAVEEAGWEMTPQSLALLAKQ